MNVKYEGEPFPLRGTARFKPVLSVVEYENVTASQFGVKMTQTFEARDGSSFTRILWWDDPRDRAVIRAEAKGLGIAVKRERDLHKFARASNEPRIMCHRVIGNDEFEVIVKGIDINKRASGPRTNKKG